MRIAYLGPAGTFTEDALRETQEAGIEYEPLRTPTVRDAIIAVEHDEAERALVPFENSIEGSVRSTLDTLAFDAHGVTIVGEYDFVVRPVLVARTPLELERVEGVLSHPQPLAQCARFIRENLPNAEAQSVESTAAAVKIVSESEAAWTAIGARAAAELYGCTILREGIEDVANNVTRFVWIAPEGTEPEGAEVAGGNAWKTSLVFSELGEDHPGALVNALREFSSREVNLTRIESRPLRLELGRYMFFCDLEGSLSEAAVSEAVEALRGMADSVRILGSYPTA